MLSHNNSRLLLLSSSMINHKQTIINSIFKPVTMRRAPCIYFELEPLSIIHCVWFILISGFFASSRTAEGRTETTVVMCSWSIARLLFSATILPLRLADEITTEILHVYFCSFFIASKSSTFIHHREALCFYG